MTVLASLVCGLVFGVGLVVSGMSNPAKVLNFLDITGNWDPSLLFVMIGAAVVTFIGYRVIQKQPCPAFAERFDMPTAHDIDGRLIGGAVCFGVGWGLGGYCPGPAITGLALHATGTLIFVPLMLTGIWLAKNLKTPPGVSRPSIGQSPPH